jgi:hypothetical protein
VQFRSSGSQILVRSSLASVPSSVLTSVDILGTSGDSGSSSFSVRSRSLVFASLFYDLKAIIISRLGVSSLIFLLMTAVPLVVVIIVLIMLLIRARGSLGVVLLQLTLTTTLSVLTSLGGIIVSVEGIRTALTTLILISIVVASVPASAATASVASTALFSAFDVGSLILTSFFTRSLFMDFTTFLSLMIVVTAS